jgi:carboxypeptidase C (cathepsin A)
LVQRVKLQWCGPLRAFLVLMTMLFAVAGFAQEPAPSATAGGGGKSPAEGGGAGAGGVLKLLPPETTTQHSLARPAGALRYSATAGTLPARDGKGEVKAELFYVAYTLEPPSRERPVTFVFNGGPGAAAAFLHLGALGPRALVFAESGGYLPPPGRVEDNPDTWLDFTDLVFVDPVGTGYSRTPDGGGDDAGKAFWGVRQDAETMAGFIRLWMARAERSMSPLFLVGESYGGFRAAILSHTLQERAGLSAAGAVLISPMLEFGLLSADDYHPLPWALRLPSFAATNFEKRGETDRAELMRTLQEVERFALSDYLLFLASGTAAAESGRGVYETLSRYTGLSANLIAQERGRLSTSRFIKEYERERNRVLSRYDGTISGPDPDPRGALPRGPDPVLDGAIPAWTSAFTAYVRDELGYRTDLTYRLLARDVGSRWDYGTSATRQGFAGSIDDLQKARTINPHLRVLIAHGYTDLVTPYFASRYLVDQLPPLAGAVPIELRVYRGGHMFYTRAESRGSLREDAVTLYRNALGAIRRP